MSLTYTVSPPWPRNHLAHLEGVTFPAHECNTPAFQLACIAPDVAELLGTNLGHVWCHLNPCQEIIAITRYSNNDEEWLKILAFIFDYTLSIED
jgi:hypothetical protein